jgi:hypothetical protein
MAVAQVRLGRDIPEENGVYKIPAELKTIYAVQKGNWAYLADSQEQLAKVAADPAQLLGDLPTRYNLAILATLKNLPDEFREQLIAQIRAGAEVGLQQMPAESDEDYAARSDISKQTIQQATTLVNDLDTLLLGWNIDAKTKTTYLDLELVARTGTKLADQFAGIKPGKSKFGGILSPGAAVTVRSIGTMSDAQVAQVKIGLSTFQRKAAKSLEQQGLGDEELKVAQQLLGDLLDVAQKTVDSKQTDSALAVMLDPEAVTVLGGVAIADGAKLQQVFKKLADEVQKNKDVAKTLKVTTTEHQGVHLHSVSLPTPDRQLATLVGESLEAVVGIADDRVFLAVGRDAEKTLKKGIDRCIAANGEESPPLEITLAVATIAKFVAGVSEDPQVKNNAMMAATLLEKAGDKGHVALTAQPMPQGLRVRLVVEEGLLKVLGATTGQMLSIMSGGNP